MMRILALLPLAVLLTSMSTASVASCFCTPPDAPTLPEGGSATSQQMQYTSHQIERYQSNARNYKQCLEQCLVEADQQSGDVIDQWNAQVEQFNARMQDE